MHDEGEICADGQVSYRDQVRRRQLHKLERLDEGHKLLSNVAIQYHRGCHEAAQ